MAGVLTAASYFTAKTEKNPRYANLPTSFTGALTGNGRCKGTTLCHGCKPESGFLPYRWDTGYSEATILYVLALGSPTFPIDPKGYASGPQRSNGRKSTTSSTCMPDPSSSIRCPSCGWIFGVSRRLQQQMGIDYFENSRRATYIHRQYGIENPMGFAHYHKYGWGLTASDGPGPAVRELNGVQRILRLHGTRRPIRPR